MYLNCHSYYSFKYGTLSVEKLVEQAASYGVPKLALTDINTTSGVFDFCRACEARQIDPAVGVDFRYQGHFRFIGLAHDPEGFSELNRFLTRWLRGCKSGQLPPVPVFQRVYIIYPLTDVPDRPLRPFEYVGVRPHEVSRLWRSAWREQSDRLVVLHPVTLGSKDDHLLHRMLRAIDCNVVLSRLPASQQALPNEHFVPADTLLRCYAAHPQIVQNTEQLLTRCGFSMDHGPRKNKKRFFGSRHEDRSMLEKLAMEGLAHRYGKDHPEARQRLRKELDVIEKLDFNAYFLISHDIVRFARHKGFAYVGRGSGANSITSYCLGITDVDPIELDLYFERFLNEYRSSPPDFDMDFSWKDRDEVIAYVLDRYGKDYTALLATFTTFKYRSVIRELGKVFGLPKAEIDNLSRPWLTRPENDQVVNRIFRYGKRLEGYPNHLSIHAGGILISEKPIYYYTATELPPKGFPITQFDMYVAEDIKFDKFDVLSQRGLGHIKSAVDLIAINRGEEEAQKAREAVHDFHRIKKDPRLNQALKKGDTLGCFYIESPAMRQLLYKLQCDDYLTLVAASSIIRPGVARSGMMREYIKNHHAPDQVTYLHPKMKELLEETYGVMVYQEDVIKIAHHFGGISMAEADVLRKGMSGKGRSKERIKQIEARFFANCRKRGYDPAVSKEVWRQIESFAGYSFSKAHSASFAVESYQSLYLRIYYPLEFITAVINNFGGFYRTEIYVNEARLLGARIHAPSVNHSHFLTHLEGKDLYLGFIHVKDLQKDLGEQVALERERRGPYRSLEDFIRRFPAAGMEQLTLLIRIGAFRFTRKSRQALLWELDLLLSNRAVTAGTAALFQDDDARPPLPVLTEVAHEAAFEHLELLGFPLVSPFDLLQNPDLPGLRARDLCAHTGKKVTMTGYLVTTKDVRTVSRELMHFGTFLDAEGSLFDTVHFPPVVKKYPFKGKGFYQLEGKVVEDFGCPSLEVDQMEKLPYVRDPRYFESTDEAEEMGNRLDDPGNQGAKS